MNKLEKQEKQSIAACLQKYCERFVSESGAKRGDRGQNKAANSLKGVSAATISHMLAGSWELITDEMWQKTAKQIGYTDRDRTVVDTRMLKLYSAILNDAQSNGFSFGVIGATGSGKTCTSRAFREENKNVYLLRCSDYWSRKIFLQELLAAMGRDSEGASISEMMRMINTAIKEQWHPLIILDEADKLRDGVLCFFITLYNEFDDGQCGFVLCGAPYLKKRIERGAKRERRGYSETYSRIGRKFIELPGPNMADIDAICQANGITGKQEIKMVAEDCEGDLRRVMRKIHALKQLSKTS